MNYASNKIERDVLRKALRDLVREIVRDARSTSPLTDFDAAIEDVVNAIKPEEGD